MAGCLRRWIDKYINDEQINRWLKRDRQRGNWMNELINWLTNVKMDGLVNKLVRLDLTGKQINNCLDGQMDKWVNRLVGEIIN